MKRMLLLSMILLSSLTWIRVKAHAAPPSADAKPSVTVFPVATKPFKFPEDFAKKVATVIATLLEKGGVEDLEVADVQFDPPDTDDVNKIAEAFGKRVAESRLSSDYAVFTHFVGSPQSGVEEIRTIVVDKSGKVILAESAGNAEFETAPVPPTDPMTCSLFVSRRLQELWHLEDPLRPNAPEGKMSKSWAAEAGFPPQQERDAMHQRAKAFKQDIKEATCTVYPVRVMGQPDRECTSDLVELLNKNQLLKAEESPTDTALKIPANTDERRVLWDTARAFREFVKTHPPQTDYALLADYGVMGDYVHHVHFILCNRTGDWIVVDMQNPHLPDFQHVDPKSCIDCNRLLLARLRQKISDR